MTGEEKFWEDLQKKKAIDIMQFDGRHCKYCSNNYWDGNQARCHKNINHSSCEQGYKEYLESDISENLQKKYNKQRWTNIEYSEWLKEPICETRNCKSCKNKPFNSNKDSCRSCSVAHLAVLEWKLRTDEEVERFEKEIEEENKRLLQEEEKKMRESHYDIGSCYRYL